MSLITILRSQTLSDNTDTSPESQYDEFDENKNLSEDFFVTNATAVLQNKNGRRRSSIIKEGDVIQSGMMKALSLVRNQDSLKLISNLEKVNSKLKGDRYFCVVRTTGNQGTDEFLILGVDICMNDATIGLVLPICQDMSVTLDGDGGFKLKNKDGQKLFKPHSVHTLWSIVNLLDRACRVARERNYYVGGLSHSWIDYYMSKIKSNRAQIAEWNRMIDADSKVNSSLAPNSAIGEFVFGTHIDETARNKDEIRKHLKEIMRDEDMDTATVIYLREKLQKKMPFSLKEYRSFIADEIFIICGQMDSSSEILPYLYLGSTYNASNLEELQDNNITHILNVTRESENFFRDQFIYRNVEVLDLEDTNLLNFFDKNYEFISDAKLKNSACLVHCQRGISRSATVVIAYMMKEFNWSCDKAVDEVRQRRDCVHPNDGFMLQLKTYEGILKAKRHFISQMPNANEQVVKRKPILSAPNEFGPVDEKNQATIKSCPIPDQRPPISIYASLLPSSTEDSSPMVKISSSSKVDTHDCLMTNKAIITDINQNDCLVEEDESAELRENVPNNYEVLRNSYQKGNIFTFTPDISTSTISDPNNNYTPDKIDSDSITRRSLRLKGDDSWIKPPTTLTYHAENPEPSTDKAASSCDLSVSHGPESDREVAVTTSGTDNDKQ